METQVLCPRQRRIPAFAKEQGFRLWFANVKTTALHLEQPIREMQAGFLGAVVTHEEYVNHEIIQRVFGEEVNPWQLVKPDDEPILE